MANQIEKINNKINKFRVQNNGKRKPSKWQLYLKECMPNQSNDAPFSEKVATCSIKYKELKEKNPKYLDELAIKADQKYQNQQET